MNFETLLYGLVGLLIGLIGVIWNAQRSAKDKKNVGWTYSIVKYVVASWGLVIVGVILILIGIFNIE